MAAPATTSLTLNWTDTSGIEDGFRIETSDDNITYSTVATVGANVETYTITGLAFNYQAWYQVIAFNGVGDQGTPLGPVQVYTEPDIAPSALSLTVTDNDTLTLDWTDGNSVSGNKIYRSEEGGAYVLIAEVVSGVEVYEDTSITPSLEYEYYLVGYNDNGTQSDGETDQTAMVSDWANVALDSAEVSTDGDSVTLTFTENVSFGSGGSGGFSLELNGSTAVALTYSSGDGTNTLIYTTDQSVLITDAATISYVQPTDGVEKDRDGVDLLSITDQSVTNNSTELPAPDFYWDMETDNANTFTDDGVVTYEFGASPDATYAQAGTYSLLSTGGFINAYFDSGASGGANYDKNQGSIELYFRYTASSGSSSFPFQLENSGGSIPLRLTLEPVDDDLDISVGSQTVTLSGFSNSTWHRVRIEWDYNAVSGDTLWAQRDSATPVSTTSSLGAVPSGDPRYMRLGSYKSGGFSGCDINLDEFRLWKTNNIFPKP